AGGVCDMTAESLLELCAGLGIKLDLAGDGRDRLQVDAPKGSLTPSLREALSENKINLVNILRNRESETSVATQPQSSIQPSAPQSSSPLQPAPARPHPTGVDLEIKNLLSGRAYDAMVIEPSDAPTRQFVSGELLAALTGHDLNQRERARNAFLDHGYFDDATRDLRTAESPAERAAAAKKLGAVGSRLSTAHLVAALFDAAPEVRRATVEALRLVRDPAAVTPLNKLLARETNEQVPHNLIRETIHAILTVATPRQPTFTPEAIRAAPVTAALTKSADPTQRETRTALEKSPRTPPTPTREDLLREEARL